VKFVYCFLCKFTVTCVYSVLSTSNHSIQVPNPMLSFQRQIELIDACQVLAYTRVILKGNGSQDENTDKIQSSIIGAAEMIQNATCTWVRLCWSICFALHKHDCMCHHFNPICTHVHSWMKWQVNCSSHARQMKWKHSATKWISTIAHKLYWTGWLDPLMTPALG